MLVLHCTALYVGTVRKQSQALMFFLLDVVSFLKQAEKKRIGQDRARQDKARQGKARQGMTGPGKGR